MRADAAKNRYRILEAAEDVFATEGVSAPIDAVAERAGVGVGTLYRHFPTKEALIIAIILTRLDDLLAEVSSQAGAEDAGGALFSFLETFAHVAMRKHDLFDALGTAGIDVTAQCGDRIGSLKAGITVLLERAAAENAVRDDVSAEEVIGLVVGVCMTGSEAEAITGVSPERMLGVVFDGLRPPATAVAPATAAATAGKKAKKR